MRAWLGPAPPQVPHTWPWCFSSLLALPGIDQPNYSKLRPTGPGSSASPPSARRRWAQSALLPGAAGFHQRLRPTKPAFFGKPNDRICQSGHSHPVAPTLLVGCAGSPKIKYRAIDPLLPPGFHLLADVLPAQLRRQESTLPLCFGRPSRVIKCWPWMAEPDGGAGGLAQPRIRTDKVNGCSFRRWFAILPNMARRLLVLAVDRRLPLRFQVGNPDRIPVKHCTLGFHVARPANVCWKEAPQPRLRRWTTDQRYPSGQLKPDQ